MYSPASSAPNPQPSLFTNICIGDWFTQVRTIGDNFYDCVDHNKLWKILQEMGIPDHLTCLLRNLYAGQEATGRTEHGTIDWFQIRKGLRQGCILSSCLFNFYAEYIMRNTGLDEAQAGDCQEKYQSPQICR